MDSFFEKIFLAIQNRITQEVPEILWIDQDLGQLASDEYRRMIFPTMLIDFPTAPVEYMGQNIKLVKPSISILLLFNNYSQTHHLAPQEVKEKGLEYLRIEQKVVNALQGWNEDYFSPLAHTNTQSRNNNEIGMRARELTFTTSYEDWSLEDDQYKNVTFNFNGGFLP